MNNKNIFARLFESFDTGAFFKKPLQWIYILFGIANLCYPIYKTIQVKSDGDVTTGMVISLIYLFFVGIFNVYFWINRCVNLGKYVARDNNLTVIPLIAHMTKSFGEWLGMNTLLDAIPLMVLLKRGPAGLILLIFIGCIFLSYVIILLAHFIAEEINVFAAIANNTKIISTACTEGKAPTPKVPTPTEPKAGNELKSVQGEEGNSPKVRQIDNSENPGISYKYIAIALMLVIIFILAIVLLVKPSSTKPVVPEPPKTEINSNSVDDTSAVVDSMPSDYSSEDSAVDQSYGNDGSSSDYSSDDEYPSGDEYGSSSY